MNWSWTNQLSDYQITQSPDSAEGCWANPRGSAPTSLSIVVVVGQRCRRGADEDTAAGRRHRREGASDRAPNDLVEERFRRAIGLREIHGERLRGAERARRILLVERHGQIAAPKRLKVRRALERVVEGRGRGVVLAHRLQSQNQLDRPQYA